MSRIKFNNVREIEMYYDIVTLKFFPDIAETIVEIFNGEYNETPKSKYQDNGDILYVLGLFYSLDEERKRIARSIELWYQAIDQGNTYAYATLGNYYENEGNDLKEALDMYITGMSKKNEFATLLLGILHFNTTTDNKTARKLFSIALDINNKFDYAYYYMGLLFVSENDIMRAESAFLKSFCNGYMESIFALRDLYRCSNNYDKYFYLNEVIDDLFSRYNLVIPSSNITKLRLFWFDTQKDKLMTYNEVKEYYYANQSKDLHRNNKSIVYIFDDMLKIKEGKANGTIHECEPNYKIPNDMVSVEDILRWTNMEYLYPPNANYINEKYKNNVFTIKSSSTDNLLFVVCKDVNENVNNILRCVARQNNLKHLENIDINNISTVEDYEGLQYLINGLPSSSSDIENKSIDNLFKFNTPNNSIENTTITNNFNTTTSSQKKPRKPRQPRKPKTTTTTITENDTTTKSTKSSKATTKGTSKDTKSTKDTKASKTSSTTSSTTQPKRRGRPRKTDS